MIASIQFLKIIPVWETAEVVVTMAGGNNK
jgi:hypothetical protein